MALTNDDIIRRLGDALNDRRLQATGLNSLNTDYGYRGFMLRKLRISIVRHLPAETNVGQDFGTICRQLFEVERRCQWKEGPLGALKGWFAARLPILAQRVRRREEHAVALMQLLLQLEKELSLSSAAVPRIEAPESGDLADDFEQAVPLLEPNWLETQSAPGDLFQPAIEVPAFIREWPAAFREGIQGSGHLASVWLEPERRALANRDTASAGRSARGAPASIGVLDTGQPSATSAPNARGSSYSMIAEQYAFLRHRILAASNLRSVSSEYRSQVFELLHDARRCCLWKDVGPLHWAARLRAWLPGGGPYAQERNIDAEIALERLRQFLAKMLGTIDDASTERGSFRGT